MAGMLRTYKCKGSVLVRCPESSVKQVSSEGESGWQHERSGIQYQGKAAAFIDGALDVNAAF
jgi:hypothetical protein